MLNKFTRINVFFSLYFCVIAFCLTNFEKDMVFALIAFVVFIVNVITRNWILGLTLALICLGFSLYWTILIVFLSFIQPPSITSESMKIFYLGFPICVLSIIITFLVIRSALNCEKDELKEFS